MKKRHYLLLSDALRSTRPAPAPLTDPLQLAAAHREQWRRDVNAVADALASDARNFDKTLFLYNCEAS